MYPLSCAFSTRLNGESRQIKRAEMVPGDIRRESPSQKEKFFSAAGRAATGNRLGSSPGFHSYWPQDLSRAPGPLSKPKRSRL